MALGNRCHAYIWEKVKQVDKALIATASIGRSHGVDGYLRIHPYSGEVEHLARLEECTIVTREGKSIATSVESVRFHADSILMRFSSYCTREKAQRLAGGTLYVDREHASPLEEGEYYIADLYGLSVTCRGERIGTVEAVADGAQADYLLVRREGKSQLVIPNMPPFVSRPDFENGTIELIEDSLLEN